MAEPKAHEGNGLELGEQSHGQGRGTLGQAQDFWAVIPAGGAGTRLWPLSREAAPKFLLDLTGAGRSLLQATLDRLAPVCDDRLVVVTGERHVEAVRRQLPQLPESRLLAEPARRDSMAAIGWAAAVVERLDPHAIIGSFAADHVIPDAAAFQATVREAVTVARQGWVVTIGITPTGPETGFGYIEQGEPLGIAEAPHARQVMSFVEKPDRATAERYLQTGRYRWNAGMFVVQARVLLDLLAQYRPALARGLREIAASDGVFAEQMPTGTTASAATAPPAWHQIWEGLERIAIDHAVAEPAAAEGRVAVVPADFRWEDVGDFDSLVTLLAGSTDATAGRVQVVGDPDQVLGVDSSGLVIPGSGRLVAVLGMPDVVVIDTPDAVLVTRTDRAQDVKQLVDRLHKDRPQLT